MIKVSVLLAFVKKDESISFVDSIRYVNHYILFQFLDVQIQQKGNQIKHGDINDPT